MQKLVRKAYSCPRDLSRLASVNCGASTWAQNFSYDPFGNINKGVPSGSTGTAYAAAYSALTNQVSGGISPLPNYDKNGNQLSSTGLSSITWNAGGQPISVTPVSTGSTITGTYDALGRLVENVSSGTGATYYDYGTLTATIGGCSVSTSYGPGSTDASLASALASNILNSACTSLVSAGSSGSTVSVTSRQYGTANLYALSASESYDPLFANPSYTLSASSMTAGSTTYDSGSLVLVVEDGASTCEGGAGYAQGSTPATMAASLASSLNAACSVVTATASGASVTVTAKALGSAADYSLEYTGGGAPFDPPSFALSGSSAMSGGSSTAYAAATITITGAEQSGSQYTGTFTVSGTEQSTTGNPATQFVYSPAGVKVAVVTGGITGTLAKGTVPLPGGETAIYNSTGLEYIRHKDYLGSSRLATTWAHAVYSKEAYAPFGETYDEAGTADRSFTGQDQDTVTGSGGTGVYDYLFRKYDPAAGRWISPDPAGWAVVNQGDPQSLNRYSYVENQSQEYVDQDGRFAIDLGGNCFMFFDTWGVSASDGTGDSVSDSGIDFGGVVCFNAPITQPGTQPITPPSAANGGPSQSKCLGQTALNNTGSLLLDGIGIIPGANDAEALIAGATGVFQSIATKDATGATGGIVSAQFGLVQSAAKELGVPLAKAIPVLGNLLNAGLALRDAFNAYADYAVCMAGGPSDRN